MVPCFWQLWYVFAGAFCCIALYSLSIGCSFCSASSNSTTTCQLTSSPSARLLRRRNRDLIVFTNLSHRSSEYAVELSTACYLIFEELEFVNFGHSRVSIEVQGRRSARHWQLLWSASMHNNGHHRFTFPIRGSKRQQAFVHKGLRLIFHMAKSCHNCISGLGEHTQFGITSYLTVMMSGEYGICRTVIPHHNQNTVLPLYIAAHNA